MIKVGDKVTCMAISWLNPNGVRNFKGPKYLEVVQVRDVKDVGFVSNTKVMISLMGYNDSLYFPAKDFRPLDREFAEMICNQFKEKH